MRVLFVTDSYPPAPDGHAVAVKWWQEHLENAGYEVLISTPQRPRLWGPRPDIIFLHGYGLRAALTVALLPGVPIVSFVHRHTYKDIPRLLRSVPWLVPLATRIVYHRQQRFLQYSTHIVTPSAFAANLTVEMAPSVPVTVLPTGVDDEFLAAAGTATPAPDPVVLYLGRRTPEKEFEQFIAAALREPEWHWRAVGSAGPHDQVAREAGITLLPNTSREGVIAELQRSGVLLFPSRIETQGLVATEALTIGVPVVAPVGSAQAEQIVPGVNGELYDPAGGADAMCRAVRGALALGVVRPRVEVPGVPEVVFELGEIFREVVGEAVGV